MTYRSAIAVAASGLTPGNPAVWFGVERRVDRRMEITVLQGGIAQ